MFCALHGVNTLGGCFYQAHNLESNKLPILLCRMERRMAKTADAAWAARRRTFTLRGRRRGLSWRCEIVDAQVQQGFALFLRQKL